MRAIFCVSAVLASVLGWWPTVAQGSPRYLMTQRVVIANEDCFVLRAAVGRLTPERRVDLVNERLAYILGYEHLAPGNVYPVDRGASVGIFVGRSLLVTVTAADARAGGTRDVHSLAAAWLRRLRHALPRARPVHR